MSSLRSNELPDTLASTVYVSCEPDTCNADTIATDCRGWASEAIVQQTMNQGIQMQPMLVKKKAVEI